MGAEVESSRGMFGRYALGPVLGSGGMATVRFGAATGALGFARPVAIKRIHATRASDTELLEAIRDEARLMRKVEDESPLTFVVTLASLPAAATQSWGLLLWGGPANFVRFEVIWGANASSLSVASYHVKDGAFSFGPKTNAVSLVTKLRVIRAGGQLQLGYSADDGATWSQVPGSPLASTFALTEVGLYIINAGSVIPATSAVFDSFSILK